MLTGANTAALISAAARLWLTQADRIVSGPPYSQEPANERCHKRRHLAAAHVKSRQD